MDLKEEINKEENFLSARQIISEVDFDGQVNYFVKELRSGNSRPISRVVPDLPGSH